MSQGKKQIYQRQLRELSDYMHRVTKEIDRGDKDKAAMLLGYKDFPELVKYHSFGQDYPKCYRYLRKADKLERRDGRDRRKDICSLVEKVLAAGDHGKSLKKAPHYYSKGIKNMISDVDSLLEKEQYAKALDLMGISFGDTAMFVESSYPNNKLGELYEEARRARVARLFKSTITRLYEIGNNANSVKSKIKI